MLSPLIFGVVPPWISNWLTPVWLVGVGVAAGLALLLALWAVVWLLSLIPPLATLSDKPALQRKVVTIVAALAYFCTLPFLAPWVRQVFEAQGAQEGLWALLGAIAVFPAIWLGVLSITALVSRQTVREIPVTLAEGVLWPVFLIAVCLAVFGAIGFAIVQNPRDILESVVQLQKANDIARTESIPVSTAQSDEQGNVDEHEISVVFDGEKARIAVFRSNQPLVVTTRPSYAMATGQLFNIAPNEDFRWENGAGSSEYVDSTVESVFVRNLGGAPADFTVTMKREAKHPQAIVVPITAAAVAGFFLLYVLQSSLAPKVSAVALSTFKSEAAQPLFAILLALGVFLLVIFIWIPYNTFGEDIKMLKDSSLTLIMVLAIIQAVWAASTSVADEIEGRTALTVLSKPLGRRSFIFGKFLGIGWTVALMFIVFGVVLLVAVAFKPIYDAKESAAEEPIWQTCYYEMASITPGLALAFMETMVLAALSVAVSTRLPMLANFVICFAIYVLGHLTPLIVESSLNQFEIVTFTGRLIATIFPNLDHFNIQAAVAAGVEVPYEYLGWSLAYCGVYSMIAMFLALAMFEDRDLA